jgi:hypothetical protein
MSGVEAQHGTYVKEVWARWRDEKLDAEGDGHAVCNGFFNARTAKANRSRCRKNLAYFK